MSNEQYGWGSQRNTEKESAPANSGQKDFSDQFMPRWRLYFRTRLTLTGIWILFVVGSLANIPGFNKALAGILTALTITWVIYTFLTVRCPNCSGFLLNFGKSRLYLAKECPHCGAILKKSGINFPIHPWIPWEEKESREKAIIISLCVFFAVLIILALLKGVKIEHTHVE